MEKLTDLTVEDRGEDNIFDGFASLIERLRMGSVPSLAKIYTSMEESVMKIERYFQDISDRELSREKRALKRAGELLGFWLAVFENQSSDKRLLRKITLFLEELESCLDYMARRPAKTAKTIARLNTMVPRPRQVSKLLKAQGAESLPGKARYRKAATPFYNLLMNNKTDTLRGSSADEEREEAYAFTIEFKTHSASMPQISFLLWTLSSGLESIEGVTVELEDWGRGSFWARLVAKIRGRSSQDEFLDILGKSRQATEDYYLNRHIEGVANTVAQRVATEKDQQRKPSVEQSQELNQLELDSKRLAYKQQLMEYDMKKLEYAKRLSEVIRDGLVQVDSDYTLSLESLVICKKVDGKFYIGDNLDRIGSDETDPIVEV